MGFKRIGFLNSLLVLLVFFNIFILLLSIKKTDNNIKTPNIQIKAPYVQDDEFIDQTCPDLSLNAIDININLRELLGKVIIIKFSKFYRTDISNLAYLEHITNKFSDQGIYLILISYLGNLDSDSLNKIYRFSLPIVIDQNGEIASLFNASPDEIILINRDFKIKMKLDMARLPDKTVVYHELMRLLFPGDTKHTPTSDSDLISALKKAEFLDVFKGEVFPLINQIKKKTILNIFTSTCTGCKESARIQLLKDITDKIKAQDANIMILFGANNNSDEIKRFALLNGWNKAPITVGVFNLNREFTSFSYHQLYELDTDPRTILLDDKMNILFKEKMDNTNRINKEYLMDKIE